MAQECVGVFPHLGCLARVGPPLVFLRPMVRRGRKRLTRGEKKSLRRNLCVADLDPDMCGWELEIPWEGEDSAPCPLKPREVLEVQWSIVRVPSQVVALITVPPLVRRVCPQVLFPRWKSCGIKFWRITRKLPFGRSCGQTPPAWNLWNGYHTTQGGSGSLHS